MKILEPVEYIDTSARAWPVPAGIVVDGASIPGVFWSVIGGPFEGRYRAPSVVHDYYCETRSRKAADVHKVFYDAMLAVGVERKKAWLMYQAVDRFGPQWDAPRVDPGCETLDDNFDIRKCAKNSAPPGVRHPDQGKSDLMKFAGDMEGEANPEDLAKLRQAIEGAY